MVQFLGKVGGFVRLEVPGVEVVEPKVLRRSRKFPALLIAESFRQIRMTSPYNSRGFQAPL
jgi:hypothetical protein